MLKTAVHPNPTETDAGRFAALLCEGGCPRPEYDQVLFEGHGYVVAPTLGSIIPNWLLVIPRESFVNFAHVRAVTGTEPHQVVTEVLERCGIESARGYWFEHGPATRGSQLACGVDHAHLHVIIDA